MRQLIILASTTLLLSFVPRSTQPPLTEAERKAAIAYLEETQAGLEAAIAGLSEEQLNWKPAPEVWSVAECVEHITLSESNIFNWMMSVVDGPANPDKKSERAMEDEAVKAAVSSRAKKVKTSEAFVPSGKFGNTEETMAEFKERRAKTIEFVKTTDASLRDHLTETPFGIADSYQLVLFLTAHSKRHTAQIEEVKATEGFPEK